jgi:hypothetical protein
MGTTETIMILIVLGAVFIIGFAWLMGLFTPRKQTETHCPFCDKVIKKGSTVCEWCGKEIPAEVKT